jgi:hypothetical protein
MSPNHAPSTPPRHATLWRGPLPQPPCQLGRHTGPVECPGSAPAARQGCGRTSTQHTPTTPPPSTPHTTAAKALSEATQPHLTAPPARSTGHKCCPRNPRGRGNQRSHAGRADGSQADAAAWAAARATQQLRAACSHPACVASPVHAHESQTDSLLAGARRYMPHRCACTRATSTLLRRLRCAWRIRSRL